jgi:hypothetical protein
MSRETADERLARCQAQNYRLIRLLAEHEIDVPGPDGFTDTMTLPARRPNETAEEEAERLRRTLAEVRGRLNMFAIRTSALTWATEARSIMRVIDRAERRTV